MRPSKNNPRKAVRRQKQAQGTAEQQKQIGEPAAAAWEATRLGGSEKAKEENSKRIGLSCVACEHGRLGDERKVEKAERKKNAREKKGLKRFERIGELNGKKDLERDEDVVYERAMKFYDGLDRP